MTEQINGISNYGFNPKIVRYEPDTDEICSQCGHVVRHNEVQNADEEVEFAPENNSSVQNNSAVQNNSSLQNIQNTSLDALVQKLVNAFVQILEGLFSQLQGLPTNSNSSSSTDTSQNAAVSQNNKSFSELNQESAELERNILDIDNKRSELKASVSNSSFESVQTQDKELEQQQLNLETTFNNLKPQLENIEKEMLAISNKRQELARQMVELIGPNFNSDARVAQLQAQDQEYELQQVQYEMMHKDASSKLEEYTSKRTELLNSLV